MNSILTITNISAADGGTYACIAENDAGSVNSSVTVYIAPYFTFQPKDVLTTNGSIVNITCVAEAFPPPTLYWEILIEYGSGSGYGGVLMPSEAYEEFNPVVFGDEGVYQCVALNDFGKNTTSVYVTGEYCICTFLDYTFWHYSTVMIMLMYLHDIHRAHLVWSTCMTK